MTEPKVSRDIDLLLERNGAPMSLAFGDLKKVTEKIDFHNQAYTFLKTYSWWTDLCGAADKKYFDNFSKNCLYADGSIGVRLTESMIERQIATCCLYQVLQFAILMVWKYLQLKKLGR